MVLARSSMLLLLALAAAACCHGAVAQMTATPPPLPDDCTLGTTPDPNVDPLTLLAAYGTLTNATIDAMYNLDPTCVANAAAGLAGCLTDLVNEMPSCCSQTCYDALHSPELLNSGCITSLALGRANRGRGVTPMSGM